ncbi:MAG: 50S ribosome-binding GTPase [Ignavibacteria bacterium]|nr:50S ribosome-binding GTPase [Ignavibacteria bacterium]
MNNTFTIEKKRILEQLSFILKTALHIQKTLDIDIEHIIVKVKSSIKHLEKEKFSIAFFGAFSDGKSSILSALTKRLDIKISPEPSTDSIVSYQYGDFEIIDTPGLFSDKLMHSEKTIKYISEANVILYTVPSPNPLKESHHPTIKWLMQDLRKASSTIFIVNKMDEVADLNNDNDFKNKSKIKTEVIIETLNKLVHIEQQPLVICVAADPGGMHLEFWQNNPDYEKISRINNLDYAINSFIKGSENELTNKAGLSVIKDSIITISTKLDNLQSEIDGQIKLENNQLSELNTQFQTFKKDISETYRNIKEQIIHYRETLLLSIEGASSIQELRSINEIKIGENGYIINEEINGIISKYIEDFQDTENLIVQQFENSIEFNKDLQDRLVKTLSESGVKLGEKILDTTNKKIMSKLFEVRKGSDLLKKLIKFKKGGESMKWASKWAGRLKTFGKFLKALPILIEALDIVLSMYNQNKFNNEREKLKSEIKSLFKDFIDGFLYDDFIADFYPNVKNISESIDLLVESQNTKMEIRTEILAGRNELSNMEKSL